MNRSLSLAVLAAGAAICCRAQGGRPNVLVLLVDDMQTKSIHAFGGQAITPNIDGLIAQGTAFTRCFTNGSLGGALSMPSRAMIMTGRHIFEIESNGATIPSAHTTMPEYFRSLGYATFGTGKWHSDKSSFWRSFGCGDNIFMGGMLQYENGGQVTPHLRHFDPTGKYSAKPFVGNEFSSQMFADAAITFLDSIRGTGKP